MRKIEEDVNLKRRGCEINLQCNYTYTLLVSTLHDMVQRLGRVGDESAESYPSRPAPRRVRVTSQSTQLRGDQLSRESELTRSTRHYDDFVPHRNLMWK